MCIYIYIYIYIYTVGLFGHDTAARPRRGPAPDGGAEGTRKDKLHMLASS